ncbi:9519_t:CDS:2, partial [Funneliformis caledonium]
MFLSVREGTKVSVLGSVVATVLRVAPGNNYWIICLNSQPENEIEISSGRMKFVAFSTTSSDTDQNMDDEKRTSDSKMDSETDILSNTNDSSEDGEVINVIVHIADISKATPRQFFKQFMPVDFIMSVWSDLTWIEFIRFIGILTIMTYVKYADICDYWFIKQETAGVSLAFDIPANDDPFHFAQQFHDEFNENLTKAILPVDKSPFQRKIPRKPHPIGCEFKTLADTQINLFLRLDPVEPSECAIKKKFLDQYPATVASMLRL